MQELHDVATADAKSPTSYSWLIYLWMFVLALLVGVPGHMGSRAIYAFEKMWAKKLDMEVDHG